MTQQIAHLKFNNASKLTLQTMLAFMLALMAAAVKLKKVQGT
jgi:hypothetical protein